MPSIRLLVVTILLVLSGVDAKKHRVRVSKWANEQCDGHPLGGKQLDLKEGKCHYFIGGSIRVQQHNKNKYNTWINGEDECFVTVYDKPGCLGGRNVTTISVPKAFEECIALSSQASSLSFGCTSNHGWDIQAFNTTTVLPKTSYSIDNEGHAHPSEYSTTITTSGHSLGAYHMAARAEPTANTTHVARGQYDVKSLWAKHPWTGSDICYKCWTKKKLHYGKIECRSGPRYDIDCGPRPLHVPGTSILTATATHTAEFYFTTTNQFAGASTAPEAATAMDLELEKRSRHRAVIVENPYLAGLFMCADAEWENEGNVSKQEIRLQKFKKLEKCKGKHAVYINFDKPLTTAMTISYATATATLSTRPTWAPTP